MLTLLSFYGINLTKIQSLPIIGREWEYRFYVDVTFDDPVRYRQAVDAARPLTSDFRILGEYAEYPNPCLLYTSATERFPTSDSLPVLAAFARFTVRLHEKGICQRMLV